MKDHELRVIDERDELSGRLAKLKAFRQTDTYFGLSAEEQDRLTNQSRVMGEYLSILAARIAAFASIEPEGS